MEEEEEDVGFDSKQILASIRKPLEILDIYLKTFKMCHKVLKTKIFKYVNSNLSRALHLLITLLSAVYSPSPFISPFSPTFLPSIRKHSALLLSEIDT